MDYDELARKIYEGVHLRKCIKQTSIFSNAEILKLNRQMRSVNFEGELLFFALKMIKEHFRDPCDFTLKQREILSQCCSTEQLGKIEKKSKEDVQCTSAAAKFCMDLHDIIF